MSTTALSCRRHLSRPRVDLRALVVVAHPDDELLGAGGLLPNVAKVWIAHLTDGAPADPEAGVDDPRRLAYARRRREELEEALSRLGLGRDCAFTLGLVDQRAMRSLVAAACAVAGLVHEHAAELLLTHAYEGGHPDHDAAAFACHAAAALTARAGGAIPWIVEMPLYRRDSGRVVQAEFIPPAGGDAWTHRLSPAAEARKRHALEAYVSQRQVVASFDPRVERYRTAPAHDFGRPPHGGELHYESEGWACGEEFRCLAAHALRELRVETAAR